jgi:glycosyltransferase involved in cell wall biosynthesis
MGRPVALLLGPQRDALSGVSTHLNLLFDSSLADDFALVHFQVGSEGRNESAAARLLRLLTSPFRFAAAVIGRRVSIVHVNTALNVRAYWRDLAYLLVAKLCGARVIYQVHGGALPQAFGSGIRAFSAFLRATLRLPDAIVVLARSELEAFRDFVPGQLVLALPNAVDCAANAHPQKPHSEPGRALRLLYIGRLAREKGLYETLRGLQLALAQGVDAELTIAGSGPEGPRLRQAVGESRLERYVAFAGPVTGEDKARLLRETDASILASYAEGLPYALLESMAAGVPVIATSVGAVPDVIVDGVHGVLLAAADPQLIADAIRTLASNRDLLAKMGEASRIRIASRYAIDRLAGEFTRLYAGVCGARKSVDAART